MQVLLRIEGVSPQTSAPTLTSALRSALSDLIPAADPALTVIADVQLVAAAPALHPNLPGELCATSLSLI